MNKTEFWKRKLMALLHDPPDKALDIARHEEMAASLQRGAGFVDEDERLAIARDVKPADWFASSAERFVFPKGKCAHAFSDQPLFIHPLSSEAHQFPPNLVQMAGGISAGVQNGIKGVDTDDWQAKFFLYWRRWQENVVANQAEAAFLPADSRIPDHTIWNHMAVTSALAGCIEGGVAKPELLLFQLGPVQEFIAQARSTRDLWSGSYLVSWLMAHAMKAVSDEIGPDAIIFPSLRGNGIFDALHKDTYYSTQWKSGDDGKTETTWERLQEEKGNQMADWLLTPSLPNRFLAAVPAGQGGEMARKAEEAVRKELTAIGDAVWVWVKKNGGDDGWKARWDAQIEAFPQVTWAVQPWLERDECLKSAPDKVAGHVRAIMEIGEVKVPQGDRDERYYADAGKTRLNNPGLLWSAHYALVDAKLAARRNTRDFAAWDPVRKDAAVKDSLSGKEECIGDEDFWKELGSKHQQLFKAQGHTYGAMNLIKRLWCRGDQVSYLRDRLGLDGKTFGRAIGFDSVPEIAQRNDDPKNPYVAVIAMDGDEMGKWVSGEKTPKFLGQLAPKVKEYLKQPAGDVLRLLTPSYHLQFSEALGNFATHKARSIVDNYNGQLVYAGGDDVLAIVPSQKALQCAQALRQAFRTDFQKGRIYPGVRCDVSCGIAVGHMNAPLQMLVKEAQRAEKRAKSIYRRAACATHVNKPSGEAEHKEERGEGGCAIHVYKRSGETIEWGCKWESGNALELMGDITRLTKVEKLSGRFPYALSGLLKPYALKGAVTEMLPVIRQEVRHVLGRQGAGLGRQESETLAGRIDAYLDSTACRLEDFINLFLVETFMNRQRGED